MPGAPDDTPLGGYAAAATAHAGRIARGWKPLGRKIGFTNRSLWPRYGVHEPIWGHVYDRTLVPVADGRATVDLAGIPHPRIEPEICFKLARRPARTREPRVLALAVEWVAHAVEIVQCERASWQVTLDESCAQNGLHARLVVGAPLAPAADLPDRLPDVAVVLSKNGREVERGRGENALGSPLLALAHLVDVLSRQPGAPALQPGEIISTGTLTDAHPVAPGETWRTRLEGMPLAGLEIAFR